MNFRKLLLISASLLIFAGCNTEPMGADTPDGFPPEFWGQIAEKNPSLAKVAEYIQQSDKRRKQRDIYLSAIEGPKGSDDYYGEINGHVACGKVEKNQMTGQEFYSPYLAVSNFYLGLELAFSMPSNETFTQNMCLECERSINDQKQMRRYDAIPRIKDAEAQIKAIGD